jgi:hypothetical protein
MSRRFLRCLALAFAVRFVCAHDHHGEDIPQGEAITPDPIDSTLWWHICIMIVAFGILFPTGMVLGIIRSRFHVPVQVVATVLAVTGW